MNLKFAQVSQIYNYILGLRISSSYQNLYIKKKKTIRPFGVPFLALFICGVRRVKQFHKSQVDEKRRIKCAQIIS